MQLAQTNLTYLLASNIYQSINIKSIPTSSKLKLTSNLKRLDQHTYRHPEYFHPLAPLKSVCTSATAGVQAYAAGKPVSVAEEVLHWMPVTTAAVVLVP